MFCGAVLYITYGTILHVLDIILDFDKKHYHQALHVHTSADGHWQYTKLDNSTTLKTDR